MLLTKSDTRKIVNKQLKSLSAKDKELCGSLYYLVSKTGHLTRAEQTVVWNSIDYLGIISKNNKTLNVLLFFLMSPLIKKLVIQFYTKYCLKFIERISIDDLFHEAYLEYIKWHERWDPSISPFLYYIKMLFIPSVNRRWYKIMKPLYNEIPRIHPNSQYKDNKQDDILNIIIEQNLFEDINTFFNSIKKRQRTKTVTKVIDEYFLGDKTISEISKELNITYHAVYDVSNRIKRELSDMLNNNDNCNYNINLDKTKYTTFTIEKKKNLAKFEIKSLKRISCSKCGKTHKIYKRDVMDFLICKKCGNRIKCIF